MKVYMSDGSGIELDIATEFVSLASCMGVCISQREEDGPLVFNLLFEDDESWFLNGDEFHVAWLDELIMVLQNAKNYMMMVERCNNQKGEIINNFMFGDDLKPE